MFWFNPVDTGRLALLLLRDGMSKFGRLKWRNNISNLLRIVGRHLDAAVEEIRAEVVNELLHYLSIWLVIVP
ncbi:unnamed protein product [Haemonchus placei]|uniref:DUF1800 family protein n=1 Tax=Haemonchus placei TaxID=6290 RepID=A0A0N4W9Z5_HAEPC|nr:unnamed protein product [Haemonchus placei]